MEEEVIVTGTVANDAVAVHVGTMDNAATVANGKFTATVKLTVGDNNILVHAVDLAGNASEQTVKVTKTVGTAASIDAADITVGAGESVDVAAAVKDAKGNAIADAEITGEATGETPIGTYADGKFTAGEKAGEGTLTLKSGELTKEVKVTVTAGVLAKVEGEKASAAPGEPLKLVGKDKFGNTVEGVTFSEDSANAFIDAANGTFIGTESGSYTVKATKGDVTIEGKIGVYGEIDSLKLTTDKEIVANGDSEVTVTITAVDKNGSVVSDFDGVIEIDATTDSDVIEMTNGVATWALSASSDFAGSTIDIVAQVSDEDFRDVDGETSIEAVAQVATALEIDAPEYLPTNQAEVAQTVTVSALDQVGEAMDSGDWDVDIKITGPAELAGGGKSDTITVTAEEGEFEVVPDERVTTGTVEIDASFPGLKSATATMKAAAATDVAAINLSANRTSQTVASATLGDPAKTTEYTIQLADKNGVPVSDDDRTVRLKFEGVSDSSRLWVQSEGLEAGAWTALSDGTIELATDLGRVKFKVAGEVAEKVTVSASDPSGALKASSGVAVTLNAGAAAAVNFPAANLYLKQADDATAPVTAQLYDAYGNKVAKSGVKLTFTLGEYEDITLNGRSVDSVDVRTDANGQAKVEVGFEYATDEVINLGVESALEEIADLTPDDVTLQMATNIATRVRAAFQTINAGYADVEESFELVLTVTDSRGRAVNDLTAEDFRFKVNNSEIQELLDNADDGGATFAQGEDEGSYVFGGLTTTESGTINVTAEIASVLDAVKGVRSLSIRGAEASVLTVAEATDDAIYADADKRTAFTLEFSDVHGNVVALGEATTLTFAVDDPGVNTRRSPYVFLSNASGAGITDVEVGAGRTTYKFYVQTNAKNAQISIEGLAEGVVLTVNPDASVE